MLNSKRVLITGGNRRLGLAIAEAMALTGARVGFTYRGDNSRAANALSRLPSNSVAISADLDNADLIDQVVVDAEIALGGPIDILINNAAAFEYDTIDSVTADSLQLHLQVGLIAPVLLTRYVTRHKKRDQSGLIINVLDYKLINPFPDYLSYSLAKFGLEGFTRTAARELAPRWRICGIAPGYTLQAPDQNPQHFADTRDQVPLKRGPRARDVAEAIIYLANAQTITGQTLYVDGGAHMLAQQGDFSVDSINTD